MRRSSPRPERLVPPRLPSVPPQIEEHPTHLRVWSQPATNRPVGRETWAVIVRRDAPADELRDLDVQLAWELRLPVDEAVTLAAEVRRRLGR